MLPKGAVIVLSIQVGGVVGFIGLTEVLSSFRQMMYNLIEKDHYVH